VLRHSANPSRKHFQKTKNFEEGKNESGKYFFSGELFKLDHLDAGWPIGLKPALGQEKEKETGPQGMGIYTEYSESSSLQGTRKNGFQCRE